MTNYDEKSEEYASIENGAYLDEDKHHFFYYDNICLISSLSGSMVAPGHPATISR